MPGDPHNGSKVWKEPDREIGKPGRCRETLCGIAYEQAQFSPEGKAESLRSTVGTLAEK